VAVLLLLALTFAPLVSPFVIAGATLVLAKRAYDRGLGSGLRLPDAMSCVLLAVLAGAAAFGAYAYGVTRGFYILDPDQMCAAAGARGDHVITRPTLPVSVRCVTWKGEGTELVPGWVNPVVYGGLALCVLALGTAVASGLRRRTAQSSGSSTGAISS
jgi:hypothetical protein